jgi:hypothetical protein
VLPPPVDSAAIDDEFRAVRASGYLQEFVVFGTHSAGHDQELHLLPSGPAAAFGEPGKPDATDGRWYTSAAVAMSMPSRLD